MVEPCACGAPARSFAPWQASLFSVKAPPVRRLHACVHDSDASAQRTMSNGIFSTASLGTDIALWIVQYTVEIAIAAVALYFGARRVSGLASVVERLWRRPLAEHLIEYTGQRREDWVGLLEQSLAQDHGTLRPRAVLPVRVVRLDPRCAQPTRPNDFVSSLARRPRNYVLFGDAGQGKTTALLLTAYRMCSNRRAIVEGRRAIPAILPVSDLRQDIVKLVAREGSVPGLLSHFFRLLLARQVVTCVTGDAGIISALDISRLLSDSTASGGDAVPCDFRERVDRALEEAKSQVRKSRKRIQLFVDAFDEIENYESLSLASDISSALQAALWDFISTWEGLAYCIVTSRTSHKEFLSLPDIPQYEIGPTDADEIITFARYLRRQGDEKIDLNKLVADKHIVHAVFRDLLNERRLYLGSLLRFWNRLDLPAVHEGDPPSGQDESYALMLRILMQVREDNLWQNRKATSALEKRSDARQCGAMRQAAVAAFSAPAITGPALHALALRWAIDASYLRIFLVSVSARGTQRIPPGESGVDTLAYAFAHTDHRDFWAADALLESWRRGLILPAEAPPDFLKVVLAHPSVMAFLAEGYRAAEDRCQVRRQVFATLAGEVYAAEGQPATKSRLDPTIAAAALSVMARLSVFDEAPLCRWLSEPVVDTCFQGAELRGLALDECTFLGCSFAEARMQGTSLKRTVLHGCDFDNAELRGANFGGAHLGGADFTNAAFGHYPPRADPDVTRVPKRQKLGVATPTCFANADLSAARFFNVRVTLYGFLNAWAAIQVSAHKLLVATSLGLFSVSARHGDWGAGTVEQAYFGDQPDALMDVDFHAEARHMVCASRDRKVHYGHVCNAETFAASPEIPRFSELGRGISTGDQYPRRARLSKSGRYIAVGVRDGWVSFHVADRVRGAKLYPHESGVQYLEHDGPVVAVERFTKDDYGDAFITAGYDGTVWRWWRDQGGAEWKRLQLWALRLGASRKQDIVRSVAIVEDGPCRGWLLIGVESSTRAHGLYAAPYSANSAKVIPDTQRALVTLPAAVFALCPDRDAERLFLGLADGRIAMVSLGMEALRPVARDLHVHGTPDDDIVRSIVLLDDALVASISWMGCIRFHCVRERGLAQQATIMLSEVPEVRERLRQGRDKDVKEVCVARGDEFFGVRGLSRAKAEYLNRLVGE